MKEELVEGIRQAVSKGESMERAMTTFYNAGYTKEEIEEAAAASQAPVFVQQGQSVFQRAPGQQTRPLIPQQPQVIQRVSAYGQKPSGPPSKKGLAITIILVVVLLLLLGILAAVILFKEEISGLFGNLFWRGLL